MFFSGWCLSQFLVNDHAAVSAFFLAGNKEVQRCIEYRIKEGGC